MPGSPRDQCVRGPRPESGVGPVTIAARSSHHNTACGSQRRSAMREVSRQVTCVLLALVAAAAGVNAQSPSRSEAGAAPAQSELDSLGRSTPRGTVLGFLNAAREGDDSVASQFLDIDVFGQSGRTLAQQLFVVLDARLPARLSLLSDSPEGSRTNPLEPNQEVVGRIDGGSGPVEIVVSRINRKTGPVWLFSRPTLSKVPELYEEVLGSRGDSALTQFLSETRVGGARLFDWVVVILGVAVFYLSTTLLNRLLTRGVNWLWRRARPDSVLAVRDVLPLPAQLLLLALLGRWFLTSLLPLSLFVRQFWSYVSTLITVVAVAWLLILVNGRVERLVARRLPPASHSAATALLRVVRRAADVLVIFGAALATLRLFAIDPTPALAGLGVGGIAVALAAQKTLENVIAGASLVFDQAVRVGDSLKVGEVIGTVDHIGLRSTRIRTVDRTVVTIPNGQLANAILEVVSARDKYWFHPVVSLRIETTPEQLRQVVDGVERLLKQHPSVEGESVRARFFRIGSFSLDLEVSAYLRAHDWGHFLEVQQQLLLGVNEVVARAGTRIALPSQTMYAADASTRPDDVERGREHAGAR